MSVPALPTELLTTTLRDAFYLGGLPTLKACALACSTWHAIARPYTFHKVKVDTEARLDDLHTLLRTDIVVQQFVRVLVVQPFTNAQLAASPWLEHLPRTLAPILPCLSTIHLIDICDFGDHMNQVFVADFALFTTVTELSIHNATIAFEVLVSVAAALPALQHVEFGFMRPMVAWRPVPPRLHPSRLLTLAVDAGRIETRALDHIVSWLNNAPSPAPLRRVMVGTYLGSTVTTGRFLHRLGSTLKELELRLEIKLPAPVEAAVIQLDISLRHCTEMQSLTLRHVRGPVSDTVLRYLEQVPHPKKLRRLTLGVLSSDGDEMLPNFAPLATYLHDDLEEMCILHNHSVASAAVAAKLAQDLPSAADRGILTTLCVRWR